MKLNHKLLQSSIPTKIYHVLKLHKMEISTNYLTFTKLTSTTNDKFEEIKVKMSRVIQAVVPPEMTLVTPRHSPGLAEINHSTEANAWVCHYR